LRQKRYGQAIAFMKKWPETSFVTQDAGTDVKMQSGLARPSNQSGVGCIQPSSFMPG
jgi:hypothetical protein